MQQEINLYRYLPKKAGFALTPKIALKSYVAFLLALLLFHTILLWQKHKLNSQWTSLQAQSMVYQQELSVLLQEYPVSDVTTLNKNIQELQKEYDTAMTNIDLLSPAANYSAYLLSLANAAINGVWLTEINFYRSATKIVLKGYALNSELLAQFYSDLTKQKAFTTLVFKLNEIQQKSFPGNFVITAKSVNK